MPFHRLEGLCIRRRCYTKQQSSPVDVQYSTSSNDNKDIRDIVGDYFRELPNDKATIRSDTGQAIAKDRHVGDAGVSKGRR